jgi:hypothetical protein
MITFVYIPVLAAISMEKFESYAESGNALHENISIFYLGIRNLSAEFRYTLLFSPA